MHDVIIIGGGVTGAGTARDCAMRGLKVLLFEKGSPGGATTASSTHLIHGGLRYLLYDRLTTHTTCWDSGHIIRIAAPLLKRLPVIWPVYKGHSHGMTTVETLLDAYDGFQRMKGGLPHLRLRPEETLRLLPGLKREGLIGAFSFDEWWVDPVALVIKNLDSAARYGAQVETGSAVTEILRRDGKVCGVTAQGAEYFGRVVINASGPWVDKTARMAGLQIPLRLQKGTHLCYRERLTPVGLILEAEGGGRYIFVIPSEQGTLVGPTDISVPADLERVATDPEEVSYLLASVRRYFADFPERYDSTIVGARPILGQSGSEKLLSREFEVFDHARRDSVDGLLTIGGGKLSDFRIMAEAVTDAACAKLGRAAPCRTAMETLAGGPLAERISFPKPWRAVKSFLRHHPRLRELHALAYLGAGLGRHLAREALGRNRDSTAESFRGHYKA